MSTTKTPRQQQIERLLKETPTREVQVDRFVKGRSQATGRPRNYNAMKDDKLMTCLGQLRAGAGDAYNRALNGSGNPAADLQIAEDVARKRGLIQ